MKEPPNHQGANQALLDAEELASTLAALGPRWGGGATAPLLSPEPGVCEGPASRGGGRAGGVGGISGPLYETVKAPSERERGASNEEPRAEGACDSERARLCGALRGFERRMDARVAVKVSRHQGPHISSSGAPHSLSRTLSQALFLLVTSFEAPCLPLSHHLQHPLSS